MKRPQSESPMAPPVVLSMTTFRKKKTYIFHPKLKKFLAVPTVNTLDVGPNRPGVNRGFPKDLVPTQH